MGTTTPLKSYLEVAARGFFIVGLVSANTFQVAHGHFLGAGLVGFCISFMWFSNSQAASRVHLKGASLVYAVGACLGTVAGAGLARWVYGA